MAALNFTQSSFQSLFFLSLHSPCLQHAITHIFASPDYLPLMHAHAKLPFFIVYVLHQMKLHQSVMFPSLILFQRLKAHFPSARGSSSHRLFISAFMISSKMLQHQTVHSKNSHLHPAWYQVGRFHSKQPFQCQTRNTNQRFMRFRSSHARHAFRALPPPSLIQLHPESPASTTDSPVTPESCWWSRPKSKDSWCGSFTSIQSYRGFPYYYSSIKIQNVRICDTVIPSGW